MNIIIIFGTTVPFEPRPSSEASASCLYSLQVYEYICLFYCFAHYFLFLIFISFLFEWLNNLSADKNVSRMNLTLPKPVESSSIHAALK